MRNALIFKLIVLAISIGVQSCYGSDSKGEKDIQEAPPSPKTLLHNVFDSRGATKGAQNSSKFEYTVLPSTAKPGYKVRLPSMEGLFALRDAVNAENFKATELHPQGKKRTLSVSYNGAEQKPITVEIEPISPTPSSVK